jgi:hypothetical protein
MPKVDEILFYANDVSQPDSLVRATKHGCLGQNPEEQPAGLILARVPGPEGTTSKLAIC